MSTPSLLRFLNDFYQEFENTTTAEKRLEYNLLTHTFSYEESVFIDEMISELQNKNIVISQKRRAEIERLAGIFTSDLYKKLNDLNEEARKKSGITRLSGSQTSFSFVFTTDVRTGKCPNNWAQGQADVFDKIKQSYSDAYRKFFFGIRASLGKSKGRTNFDDAYALNKELNIQSKGKMGQSGHAEGEGIIETMTREFFDKHANTVFNKKNPNEKLTEQQLLSDLKLLGIDISFMRNTSDMTQNITLIGAGGNILSGQEVKKLLKEAKKRIKEIIDNPEMLEEMYDLQGSDSFRQINNKKVRKSVTDKFKNSKSTKVTAKNLGIKHSKKTVKKENKSKGRAGGAATQTVALRGVSSLKRDAKRTSVSSQPLQLLTALNKELPKVVRKNMKAPALENRTGRFADSVEVTEIQRTPKGFPSIGYTYQRNPYQVFEDGVGKEPYANGERDPRDLIDKSIREIAANLALGRFFTRRI